MNCNTTHYRANSSSVPGDPTIVTGLTVAVWVLLVQPITYGQNIQPASAFRNMHYNLHAHGASGNSDSQLTDTAPTQFDFWEHTQTPSVTKNGAIATATNQYRSLIRDDFVEARAIMKLSASSATAGENASAQGDTMMSLNFTLSDTTPCWIREFGHYDGANTYFFNSTTSETIYSFGSGWGSFYLDPDNLYFLHVRTQNQAQSSGAQADNKLADYHLSFVAHEPACVESFAISTFSEGTPISTVRDAHVPEGLGVLRLTDASDGQAGAAWYLDKAHVGVGFSTSFTFKISNGVADGFAFLIQNESPVAVGAGGSNMGYSTGFQPEGDLLFGITRSLAIEFDTFGCCGEFETPHISVQTRGNDFNSSDDDDGSIDNVTIPDIADGQPHLVEIVYVPGNLKVSLDGTLYTDISLNLDTLGPNGDNILDENGCAWIGFTGATGGLTANQDILDWTLGQGCVSSFDDTVFPPGSLHTVGSATLPSLRLSLTQDGQSGQAGAAWYPQKAHLAQGFDTTFTFEISAGGSAGDGMAFVIQDESDTALGDSGSGMGYGNNGNPGITRSLAVEIDTFSFGEPGEFNAPHVSVQTRGLDENSSDDPFSLGHASIPDVVNNGEHRARITYVPGEMAIYFDDELYLVVNVDLENIDENSILDANGCAHVGFTAGTGLATSEHDVLHWSLGHRTCEPNCSRNITAWRSVRTHSGIPLSITLNPTPTGNGSTGPTVETRQGGIQRIEVDFDGPVTIENSFNLGMQGHTTTNGVMGPLDFYFPNSITTVDADTIALDFDPGVLPDQSCYTIFFGQHGFLAESIPGDNNVNVRSLFGDTTGNGTVNLGDVLLTKKRTGQAANIAQQLDVNLSGGNVSVADTLLVKTRISRPAKKALCP